MTPNNSESERLPVLMAMTTALCGAVVMAAAAIVLLLMTTHL
jgi:hypothetical protein